MSRDPLLVRVLVAMYPPAWRHTYGPEYAALLSDTLGPVPWYRRPAIIANVLRGATDARLRSQGGTTMTTRVPLSPAIWATGLFTIAGIAFQKMTEDQDPTDHSGLVRAAFFLLLGAAGLALLVIVIAALPTALAMTRGHANGTLPLLAVPPVAFALWYGLLRLMMVIAGDHPVHSAPNLIAAAVVIAGGIGVVAATAWAAASVLRRVNAEPPRWQPAATVVLTLAMGVATLAALGWGLALRAAEPAGLAARDGLLATPLGPSWIGSVFVMAAATALATRSIRRRPAAATVM